MPYEIGRLLRRRREWARISQQELVVHTGLDRSSSYISGIENGRTSPTVEELDRLCRYFRTNLIDFLRECGGDEAESGSPRSGTAEEERLLRAFAALSAADQLLAAEMVELLARHRCQK
jgi:transcriptional regulator with XRE-family HTH domain